MRTHCKQGHPVNVHGRCPTCENDARRRLKARKYQDGLTPEERRRRGQLRFVRDNG